MKTIRTLLPLLGILTGLVACSGESATGAGAESAGTSQAKATAQEDGRPGPGRPHMMPPGPGSLLFAALHEDIALTAAQRTTIQGLVDASRPQPPDANAAPGKDKAAALAAAVRSGKVDAVTLQPPKDAMEAAHKEHAAKLASSLTTLHDTLSKEQREKLVDAIVAKAKEHGPGHKGPHEGGKRPGPPEGGPQAHGPHGPHGHGPMHLLEGIDLTEAQKKSLEEKLAAARPAPPSDADREAMRAKHEEMKKVFDAKLQSFKADAFDANAFVTPPEGGPRGPMAGHAEQMAKELSIILSVLDPAQREKLAAKIEQGPPARPAR